MSKSIIVVEKLQSVFMTNIGRLKQSQIKRISLYRKKLFIILNNSTIYLKTTKIVRFLNNYKNV